MKSAENEQPDTHLTDFLAILQPLKHLDTAYA
jgi:hypothetical protein